MGKSLQDFQKSKFNELTLPMYSVVGFDAKKSIGEKIVLTELEKTHAYNARVEDYLTFLKNAKTNFDQLNKQ